MTGAATDSSEVGAKVHDYWKTVRIRALTYHGRHNVPARRRGATGIRAAMLREIETDKKEPLLSTLLDSGVRSSVVLELLE